MVFSAHLGIKVVWLDPTGRPWNPCWKFWGKYYVMDGQWKDLVKRNGLQAYLHTVHVFAFGYCDSHICFVIDTSSGSGSGYTFLHQD